MSLAPTAIAGLAGPGDNPVVGVAEVPGQLDAIRVEGSAESLVEAHGGLATHVGAWLRPVAHGLQDHIGVEQLANASMSPAFQASTNACTISTFSCDIAYSDSPAASRASAGKGIGHATPSRPASSTTTALASVARCRSSCRGARTRARRPGRHRVSRTPRALLQSDRVHVLRYASAPPRGRGKRLVPKDRPDRADSIPGSRSSASPRRRPVERLEGPADDFHVLLRHRLLRQPGGFEGLLSSRNACSLNPPSRDRADEPDHFDGDRG